MSSFHASPACSSRYNIKVQGNVHVFPAGKEWTNFTHREDELVAVVSGTMEFVVGGDRLEAHPGDEVFIPAGVMHSTKNIGRGESRWLYGYA
jgi:mannose-6-phosphate isomerase-like protein (cupin superfamily)